MGLPYVSESPYFELNPVLVIVSRMCNLTCEYFIQDIDLLPALHHER